MKNLKQTLLLLFVSGTTAVFAQSQVKGLMWNTHNPNTVSIVNLDATNGEVSEVLNSINLTTMGYTGQSLHHDAKNDLLYFMAGSNAPNFFNPTGQLVVARASTGQQERIIDVSGSMSPFILSDRNQLGFIGIERMSHGYGNNDEDISLKIFDLSEGKTVVSVKMPNLSFTNVNSPFVGEMTNINGTKSSKDISVSTTCFLSDRNEIIFSATDVMDIQRLFRVDLSSQKIVNSGSIDVDILDLAYDADSKTLHALYLETDASGSYNLNVGTLDIKTRKMTEVQTLRVLTTNEFPIQEGSIKLGNDKIFVTKNNPAGKQDIFTMDLDHTNLQKVEKEDKSTIIDFEFPANFQPKGTVTLQNLVSVYPNPSSIGSVTLKTDSKAVVTKVKVMNSQGALVQEFEINTGLDENQIDVSALSSGVYLLEIETDASTPVIEKLIVN